VDTEFADRLAEQPGFVDYQAVATGDDMVVSMTIFEDEEQCLASNDMRAARRPSAHSAGRMIHSAR
jgi:heme-degrading monooxygenase HmoA